MSTLSILYHLARADLLERVRRHSFCVTLGLSILAGYFLVPPSDARYTVGVNIYDMRGSDYFRGVYNSAWVGTTVASMTAFFLSLVGFYLVKNTLDRDRRTRVGEIIAATPLSKTLYTLGKWLSNLAVLAVLVAAIALAACGMQLIRGEESCIGAWALLAPFLFVALPVLALVAALGVLFEAVPGLGGGVGNVVYCLLWFGILPSRITAHLFGVDLIESSVLTTAEAAFPQIDLGWSWGINAEVPGFVVLGRLQTFHWEGIQWAGEIVLGRLIWVGLALVLVLLAALLFDRFDPARGSLRRVRRGTAVTTQKAPPARSATTTPIIEAPASIQEPGPLVLTALPARPLRFRFWSMLLAELRLMLKAMPWWWFLVAVALILASLFAHPDTSRQCLLPVAWIWPLLVWSTLGTRERRFLTDQLVFSAAHPLRRQLPMTWLAGVAVTALAGSGTVVNLAVAGDWMHVLAWMVGALFVPSLALALGTWSGSSRLFEAVYTVWWYVGPINRIAPLDFVGATDSPVVAAIPLAYLVGTIALLMAAIAGRRRQLGADVW